MIGVTDVVRCIKPFWDNMPLFQPDINELFIVKECNMSGCNIINLETGSSSAWWGYDKLEKVRDGSFEELSNAISKAYVNNKEKIIM